ncbi:MAG: hypothetical protein EBS05_02420 [Proteobacteria bacterium]|nr:hypothetical protein [Pseudomonadota bacterium]
MKSRNWFLVGLLLLLAAALVMRQGEHQRQRAAQQPGPSATTQPGMWERFTSLPAALLGRKPASAKPAPATGVLFPAKVTSLSDDKDFPFRVRNTKLPDEALFRSESAVLLRNALIETREPVRLNIPAHLRAEGEPGSYLVQARGPIDRRFREVLRGAGVEIVSYVPNNAYLIRANASLAQQLRVSPYVRSVLPFEPYYKLDMQLLPLAVRRDALPEGGWLNLVVFPGQQEQAKADLRALGAVVKSEQPFPFGHVVTIAPPTDSLVALAQMTAVQNIEAYQSPLFMNDLSRARLDVSVGIDATTTNANWLNLTGLGVIVGLPGSGVDLGHPELAGQTYLNANSPAIDVSGHETFTAGAMVALGLSSPSPVYGSLPGASQRGIAPGAKVYPLSLYDVSYTNYGNYWIATNMATATNIHIVNGSFGYASFGYTINSALFDQWTRDSDPARTNDQPMTYVFAVGNKGGANSGGTGGRSDTINSPGNAKNVISVGALEQFRLVANSIYKASATNDPIAVAHTDSDNQVADFSGRGNVGVGIEGPSGRFKPDVVAPGGYVLSLRSSTFAATNVTETDDTLGASSPGTYWRYDSGTSFAAAKVSGVLALMEEFFNTNYGMTNGLNPSLNKALLINRAGSAGLAYDFAVNNTVTHQGWGIPSLSNTVPALTGISFLTTNVASASNNIIIVDESAFATNHLTTGESHAYDITLPATFSSTNTLKITLTWTDPPGNPLSSTKLVNDLDLVVSNAFLAVTNIYEGNNFAAGSLTSQTTPEGSTSQRDSVNNVENVYITGITNLLTPYRVYVIGHKVNVNAVTANTNDVVQDYTLVISTDDNLPAHGITVAAVTVPSFGTYTNRLVGAITNGVPYLEERIGANSPFAYVGTTPNTNGSTNQWNFYVFTNQNNAPTATNTVTNIVGGVTNIVTNVVTLPLTNGGPYVTFATFLPPNLAKARNKDADIDLYVTRNSLVYGGSGASGLTNLDPAVISDPNTLRSTNRGGYELISLSNSALGEIFYIGVKSEDQQGGAYGFFASASQFPYSTNGTSGAPVITLFPAPIDIPDGSPELPGGVTLYGISTTNMIIQSVDAILQFTHENLGDLVGTLTHNGVSVTLNNHAISPGATFPGTGGGLQTNILTYNAYTNPPDGPGDVTDFLGMDSVGVWILEVYDNSPFLTGRVDDATLFIRPFTNALRTNGNQFTRTITLNPGQSIVDFIDVPAYATNLDVDIVGGLPTPPTAPGQGVDLFAGYLFVPAQSNFTLAALDLDSSSPHPTMSISPTASPPLLPGRWNFRYVNNTAGILSLDLVYTLGFNLAVSDTKFYFTNSLVSLLDNYTTNLFISVPDDRVVAGVEVGLAILHPRVEDLVIHLVSPRGTRVLLFENRGGTNGNVAALNPYTSNLFANFTEDTNHTTSVSKDGTATNFLHYDYLLPIKFVPPPYSAVISPPRLMTNMTNTLFGYGDSAFTAVNESPRAMAQSGNLLVMAGAVDRYGTNDGFIAAYQTPILTNQTTYFTNVFTNTSGVQVSNVYVVNPTNWTMSNYWAGPFSGYRGSNQTTPTPDQTFFSGVAVNPIGVYAVGQTRNYFPGTDITWSGDSNRNVFDVDLGCTNGRIEMIHHVGIPRARVIIEYEGQYLLDQTFTNNPAGSLNEYISGPFSGSSRFMRFIVNPLGTNNAVKWTNELWIQRSTGGGLSYSLSTLVPSGAFQFTTPLPSVMPAVSQLSQPRGVALDSTGNVYVADSGNDQIVRFDQRLTISSVGTNATYLPFSANLAGLSRPSGVAVDTNGNIYVADTGNHQIKLFTNNSGTPVTVWGTGTAGTSNGAPAAAQFDSPEGITIAPNGTIYVADTGNNLIRTIDPTNQTVATLPLPAGVAGYSGPRAVLAPNFGATWVNGQAYSNSVNLCVADTGNNQVYWLTLSNGTWVATVIANYNQPSGLAYDGNQNVYVSVAGHNRIRNIHLGDILAGDPTSGFLAGNLDADQGINGLLNDPRGIAADRYGTIFVADRGNDAVRLLSPYQSQMPTNAFVTVFPVGGVTNTQPIGSASVLTTRGITNSVFGLELGGTPNRDYLSGIVTSPENGTNFLYAVGNAQFSSNTAAGLDQINRVFVSKLATNGQPIWVRAYQEVAIIQAQVDLLGAITNLAVLYGGSGYTAPPVVTILDPFNPVVTNQAVSVTVTVGGGAVNGITAPATPLTGPFVSPRVYVEAPVSLDNPGHAIAVAYGTNVIVAGLTNSSASPLTTNNFPFLLSLEPTNGATLWTANSPVSGHFNALAVSASGIIAVGAQYTAGNTFQSTCLIEKWSLGGTQMLTTNFDFGVGTTSVLNGVVVVDSIDRAYAVGSVYSGQIVDAFLMEIDLTTLAIVSTAVNNLTNFSGLALGVQNSTNFGTAITTDGVDIYVSVEGPCPGNRVDRQAGIFRYRAKNYYLPEESLDAFVGERTWGVGPFATNSSGTLTNITVTNKQWYLEIADTRIGGTNGNAQVLSWNLNFSYAASNTTSLTLPPNTNGNFLLLSSGQSFVVNVPPSATQATNYINASGPVKVTFNPVGAAVQGAVGNIDVFGGTAGTFVLSNSAGVAASPGRTIASVSNTTSNSPVIPNTAGPVPRLRPGGQYYLFVQPMDGSNPVNLSMRVDFNQPAQTIATLANGQPMADSMPRTTALNYYQFDVPANSAYASFEVLNPSGNVNLYLARSNAVSALPSTTVYDYRSANPGTAAEQIFLVTNTASPMALTPGTWFLGVENADRVPVTFTVRATAGSGLPYVVTTAASGQPYAAVTPPGNAPRALFRLPVSTPVKSILFEVRDLDGDGDLVVRRGAYPLATTFDAANFRSGMLAEEVGVRTNAGLPSLVGDWYFGVLNRGDTHISYQVMSRLASNGVLLGSSPIQARPPSSSMLVGGQGFGFDLDVVPGENYQIQYLTNLAFPNWQVLTNITAPPDGIINFIHSGALSNRNLYYRIQVVP